MSQIELQPGFDFQKAGKDVLEIEREGLAQLDQYINQDFSLACEKMFYCAGKVVVMGMGKSGHIGRKMAATFASTGTSSFFVHPGKPRTATWVWSRRRMSSSRCPTPVSPMKSWR
jgi:arabinose-5-phosphate isomerase